MVVDVCVGGCVCRWMCEGGCVVVDVCVCVCGCVWVDVCGGACVWVDCECVGYMCGGECVCGCVYGGYEGVGVGGCGWMWVRG